MPETVGLCPTVGRKTGLQLPEGDDIAAIPEFRKALPRAQRNVPKFFRGAGFGVERPRQRRRLVQPVDADTESALVFSTRSPQDSPPGARRTCGRLRPRLSMTGAPSTGRRRLPLLRVEFCRNRERSFSFKSETPVRSPSRGPPIPTSTASSRLTGTGNSGAALGRSSPASGLGWRWDAAKFGARRKDALVERAPLYECAGVAASGSYGRHRQALADEERSDLFVAARSLGIAAKRPLHVRRCR